MNSVVGLAACFVLPQSLEAFCFQTSEDGILLSSLVTSLIIVQHTLCFTNLVTSLQPSHSFEKQNVYSSNHPWTGLCGRFPSCSVVIIIPLVKSSASRVSAISALINSTSLAVPFFSLVHVVADFMSSYLLCLISFRHSAELLMLIYGCSLQGPPLNTEAMPLISIQ